MTSIVFDPLFGYKQQIKASQLKALYDDCETASNINSPKVTLTEDKVSKIGNEMQCLDLTDDEIGENDFDAKSKFLNDLGNAHRNSQLEPINILDERISPSLNLNTVDQDQIHNGVERIEDANRKNSFKRRNSLAKSDKDNDILIPLKRMRAQSLPDYQKREEIPFTENHNHKFKEPIAQHSIETNGQKEFHRPVSKLYSPTSNRNAVSDVNLFFESLRPYMNAMNSRQQLVFKEKTFRALIETFDDASNFPDSPIKSLATVPSNMTTTMPAGVHGIHMTRDKSSIGSKQIQSTKTASQSTIISPKQQAIRTSQPSPNNRLVTQPISMPVLKCNSNHPVSTSFIKSSSDCSQAGTIFSSNSSNNLVTTSRGLSTSGSVCKIPKQSTRPKTFVVVPKVNLNGKNI